MSAAFNKQRYLLDYALSAMARRKGKHVSLLMVYSLIVFLLASVMLFTQALRSEAAVVLAQSPEILIQRMQAGRHALIHESYLDKLGRLRGVTTREGRLWGYFYDPAVQANYTLMVPPQQPPLAGEIHIGAGIANTRGLGVGDRISLRNSLGEATPFRIGKILAADTELVSADLMLLNEPDYRAFFGIEDGWYTDLVLGVRNARELQKIAEKVSLRLPDTRPILRDEVLRTYEAVFAWRQGMVFVLLFGAGLAFVIFAWDKASGLSAEERREIGILKGIGWDTRDVMRMKFWEGAVLSLSAFFLGYLLAYVHVFWGDAMLFESVLKGWAVLYPDFALNPVIDPMQVATLFMFTVFPYTAATLIPVWKAAIADPDAVMRS